jgi:xanthine dehydrogenase YagS FAD-binding subunit
MLPNFTYIRPTSLHQAAFEASTKGACLHAGGTDLMGCLRDGVFPASKLVSLSALTALSGITATPGGGLRIGALATLAEIAAHPVIHDHYRALQQGAQSAASPQLRNQGTLGGNLCQRPRCWYFRGEYHCLRKGGDTCYAASGENQHHCIFGGNGCYIVHPSDTAPALVALGASVRLVGPKGTRTLLLHSFFVLPDKDFTRENILEPGEILTEVLLPLPAAGAKSLYRKVRERASWDFALAGGTFVVETSKGLVTRASIVLSGVAPVPWRAVAAEKLLIGKPLDARTATEVAAAAVAGADPLSENAYKVDLVRGIVEESLLALAG